MADLIIYRLASASKLLTQVQLYTIQVTLFTEARLSCGHKRGTYVESFTAAEGEAEVKN